MNNKVSVYQLKQEEKIYNLGILLEKLLFQDKTIYIICENTVAMEELDNKLWTFSSDVFIPHVINKDNIDIASEPIIIDAKFEEHLISGRDIVCPYGSTLFIENFLNNNSYQRLTADLHIIVFCDILPNIQNNDIIYSHYKKDGNKWVKLSN